MKTKRTVAALITVVLLFAALPIFASADYVSPSVLNGTENVFLSYSANYNNINSGRRNVDGYMPLVGYYDTDGRLKDTFFDAFLYLPFVSANTPSGGAFYRSTTNPNNFQDWEFFVDEVFAKNYNLDALNTATERTANALGSGYENYKSKVFLSVLYPVWTQTDFGDVDGDGISENFANYADRCKAIKWIIDEQLKRFENANNDRLELVGFYWFEEDYSNQSPNETQLVKYMTDYVRSKGCKSIWIPYQGARGYDSWKTYGFDAVCYQPNYMFRENGTESLVTNTCNTAKELGMGVEIELDDRITTSAEYYNRYMSYLSICAQKGANAGVKMYYNGGIQGTIYYASKSNNAKIRKIYDLTYKYAKQTLDPSECVKINEETLFDEYLLVSVGKSYTANTPYTATSAEYGDFSGTELTDGVYGDKTFGTEWHAFHKSFRDDDSTYTVCMDLGSVTDNLSLFFIQAEEDLGSSIGLPQAVKFYISNDLSTREYIGEGKVSDMLVTYPYYQLETTKKSARYVFAVITHTSKAYNFVFVSEFGVGVNKRDCGFPEIVSGVELEEDYCVVKNPITATALSELFPITIRVITKSGAPVLGDVCTGNIISVMTAGTVGKSKTLVILGDVTGNGKVESSDYLMSKRICLGTYTPSASSNRAADFDGDGVTAVDYLKLKRVILGTYTIK